MSKRQTEYTIDDLKRLNLGFLIRNKSDETIRQQTEAFNYLLETAQQLGADIGKWFLLPEFGIPDTTGLMQTNREEINKVLFTKLEITIDSELPSYITDSPFNDSKEHIIVDLKKSSNLDGQLSDTKSNHRSSLSNYESYKDTTIIYRNKAIEYRNEILSIESRMRDNTGYEAKYNELCKITNSPNWVFHSVGEGKMLFYTAKPCIQSLVNPIAGINQELNCGYLMAELILGNASVKVYPYVGNYKINDYYHPHLSRKGSVCFGDADNTVTDLFGEGRYAEIMEILHQLLNTYSENNPYILLSTMLDGLTGFEGVRVDGDYTVETSFVSELDARDYVLDLDYDYTTPFKSGDLALVTYENSRLCIVENQVEQIVTFCRVNETGTSSSTNETIERNRLEPFDLTNVTHLAFYKDTSKLEKYPYLNGFPRIGTLLGDGNTIGKLYSYRGTPSPDTTISPDNGWGVRLISGSHLTSAQLRNSYVLDCSENKALGWTTESIREYNAKLVNVNVDKNAILKYYGVESERIIPDKCDTVECQSGLPMDSSIDEDNDVYCRECHNYTTTTTKDIDNVDARLAEFGVVIEEVSSES